MPIEIRNQLLMPQAGMRFTYADRAGNVTAIAIKNVTESHVDYVYTDTTGKSSDSRTKLGFWRQFVRTRDDMYKITSFSYSR